MNEIKPNIYSNDFETRLVSCESGVKSFMKKQTEGNKSPKRRRFVSSDENTVCVVIVTERNRKKGVKVIKLTQL